MGRSCTWGMLHDAKLGRAQQSCSLRPRVPIQDFLDHLGLVEG
jgi:hypothetical protein